jgi:hypothetical protein
MLPFVLEAILTSTEKEVDTRSPEPLVPKAT